jgi:hypothetical protein
MRRAAQECNPQPDLTKIVQLQTARKSFPVRVTCKKNITLKSRLSRTNNSVGYLREIRVSANCRNWQSMLP